ncbi:MAG: XRE family transcriptional regulator [Acidovorax sp.]
MTAEIEVGSTNVYADLGYEDAAAMQRKSSLAAEIARAIKARRRRGQVYAAPCTQKFRQLQFPCRRLG